jgi:site-specific recombinase XerD
MFPSELETSYIRFAELREDFLVGYGYNTARAYWGDLEDILFWSAQRNKNPLALTNTEFHSYLTLLKRRKYAASTVRRRATSWRAFSNFVKNV